MQYILDHEADFTLSVSATTRGPRPGEIDGVQYQFITKLEFEKLITTNQLLEYAIVHKDNYYGTPLHELTRAETIKKHLLLEIDLQGARQIKKRVPEALTIFIAPPNWEELEFRLRNRATETEPQIQTRLLTARKELLAAGEFDQQLTNANLETCALEIIELVREFERGK